MRDWKVPFQPGFSLSLAADARFCNPSFCNDQIWELAWDGSSNPGINIQTTYGLRVRKARLFPRFIRNGKQLSDPNSFYSQLLLRKFAPNYALLTCSPFSGIEVQLEYWVPKSQVITGRISFTNKNPDTESITLEWVGTLTPLGDGESMMVYPLGPGHVLTGRSGKLCPVCYLTGSPSPTQNTSPALSVALELEAGQTRRLTWAMAGLETIENSFNLARTITARQWDAEIARLEVQNTRHTVEIITGDPDWDLALALSQKEAFGLYHRALDEPDCPVLLLNRVPDQGYSARGDGKDCDTNWNGVTPLDLHYWMQLILPGAPEIAATAIENILHHAQADGFIDLKSNTNGQKSRLLTQPLLVALCSQIENVNSQRKLRQELLFRINTISQIVVFVRPRSRPGRFA